MEDKIKGGENDSLLEEDQSIDEGLVNQQSK